MKDEAVQSACLAYTKPGIDPRPAERKNKECMKGE